MMKGKQEKLNKILSLLNVNVFELMDLTLETFGHHLIHEDAVKNCRENIDDLALEQKKSSIQNSHLFFRPYLQQIIILNSGRCFDLHLFYTVHFLMIIKGQKSTRTIFINYPVLIMVK